MQKNETGEAPLRVGLSRGLIGLYCGGMTAVTRSRRAFASFSKFATPSPFILLLLHRAISSSFFIHPLSTPSLFRPRWLPAGTAILKLNTADDSRALPRLASARKRSGGEISVLQELRPYVPSFLTILLVLLFFYFSFISPCVLLCVYFSA